jgi:hypothetical protein
MQPKNNLSIFPLHLFLLFSSLLQKAKLEQKKKEEEQQNQGKPQIDATVVGRWTRGLDYCFDEIEKAKNLVSDLEKLDSSSQKSVLENVKMQTFLKGILEIFIVFSRLKETTNTYQKQLHLATSPMSVLFLTDKIETQWQELKDLLKKYEKVENAKRIVAFVPPPMSTQGNYCEYCFMFNQETSTKDSKCYHNTCSNFLQHYFPSTGSN